MCKTLILVRVCCLCNGTFICHRTASTSGEDCFNIRRVTAPKLGSQADVHDLVHRDHGVCCVSAGVRVHVGYGFWDFIFSCATATIRNVRLPIDSVGVIAYFQDTVLSGMFRWLAGLKFFKLFYPAIQQRCGNLTFYSCCFSNFTLLDDRGKGIGKAVPLQAWSGPEGSRKLWFPDFMTTAQDSGKVVSPTHRPPLPPGNTPGTHFC